MTPDYFPGGTKRKMTKTERRQEHYAEHPRRAGGFTEKVKRYKAERRAAGKEACTCWTCLRAAGITPPLGLRGGFPQLHPHRVFAGDVRGEPLIENKVKKQEDHDYRAEAATPGLRAAVANREVI